MKIIKNVKGFTLVEILVGLGVTGFLILLIGQMQSLVSNQSTLINQRIDQETIKLDIHSLVASKDKCQGAFRQGALNLRYNGTPVAVSSLNYNNTEMVVGKELSSGVRIESITLQPAPGVQLPQTGSKRVYKAEMVVRTSFQKGPRKGSLKSTENNKYKFYVQTDAQNEITACAEKSEELGAILKSCDRQGFPSASARDVMINGTNMRVFDYGYLPNDAIDDGGKSNSDDDAYFYCVMTGDGPYGTASVCLSKESCPWR